VALLAAGPGYRSGVWSLQTAFRILQWATILGLVGALASLVLLIRAWPRGSRATLVIAGVGLLTGLVAFLAPLEFRRRGQSVPSIHDITTDTVNPPAFVAVIPLRAAAPNTLVYSQEVARQQREGYPDLGPLTLDAPPGQVFPRAVEAARDAGWEIVAADEAAGRIEATDTTFWFGFKDDVVVRLTPQGNGTRVDVRSVSRVGRSDVGTNARRIRRYLASLRPQ
jgi:uncharacterized protein (DUF1499 family)